MWLRWRYILLYVLWSLLGHRLLVVCLGRVNATSMVPRHTPRFFPEGIFPNWFLNCSGSSLCSPRCVAKTLECGWAPLLAHRRCPGTLQGFLAEWSGKPWSVAGRRCWLILGALAHSRVSWPSGRVNPGVWLGAVVGSFSVPWHTPGFPGRVVG